MPEELLNRLVQALNNLEEYEAGESEEAAEYVIQLQQDLLAWAKQNNRLATA